MKRKEMEGDNAEEGFGDSKMKREEMEGDGEGEGKQRELPLEVIWTIHSKLESPSIDLSFQQLGLLAPQWTLALKTSPELRFSRGDGTAQEFIRMVDGCLRGYSYPNVLSFIVELGGDFGLSDLGNAMIAWLHFAREKQVKELRLLDSPLLILEDPYELPDAVYQLPLVTSLELTHSWLDETVPLGWHSLAQLTLYQCAIDNLEEIIRQTRIKVLSMRSCYGFESLLIDSATLIDFTLNEALLLDSLTISTPNLQRLRLSGEININSFTIRACPRGVEAVVDFFKNTDEVNSESEYEDGISPEEAAFIALAAQVREQTKHLVNCQVGGDILARYR